MKKIITILLFLSPFVNRAQQTYEWEEASFAKTANTYIPLSKVAITANNHKIIAGRFEQSMEYKGITLTSSLYYGAFIAKLDENDSLLWIRKFAESGFSTALITPKLAPINLLEVDNTHNFYLILNFADSIFVDNQLYIANAINPEYRQALLLKFDENGNITQDFYLEGSCFKNIAGIYIDENQNTYLYGQYGNNLGITTNCTCVFDTISNTTDKQEVFLVKYNDLGDLIWVNSFGNSNFIGVNNFTIIGDIIYSTGRVMSSSINFGSYVLNLPSFYDYGSFIAKHDTSGVFKWAGYYGVKGWDSHIVPYDITALNSNAIVVGGQVYTQSEDPHLYVQNSNTLYGLPASGSEINYFLIAYDSLGNIVWKDLAQCGGRDYLSAMSKDSKGNLLVTGNYSHELYFGNDTLPNAFEDLWVGSYDSVGTKLWAKRAGGPGFASGIDIALDSDDNIYINGNTTSNPTIVGDSTYTTYGPSIFLAKMVPSLISNTTAIPLANTNKQLIKIVDVLGRETKAVKGRLLFYIYSDGTVEKQIFLN